MSNRHGIDDEPHMRPVMPPETSGHSIVDENVHTSQLDVGYGIGDEPGVIAPHGTVSFSDHLDQRRAQTSIATTWLVTCLAVIAAGPWAILAAIFGSSSYSQVVAVVIIGPLCEEVAKIAVPFLIIERWPWLFRRRMQIMIAAIAGGFVFSVIENLIYLNIYFPNPDPWMVQWRWTVCVALHTGCSFIAGIGMMRVWDGVWRERCLPNGNHGIPFIIMAACIHGLYNFLALTGSTFSNQ